MKKIEKGGIPRYKTVFTEAWRYEIEWLVASCIIVCTLVLEADRNQEEMSEL